MDEAVDRQIKNLEVAVENLEATVDRVALMPPEIAKAIAVAQSHMRKVGHDGKNAHHGYKYTSAEAIIDASIEPMAKAGLGLVQCGWEPVPPTCETWYDVNDKGEQLTSKVSGPSRLEIRYLLVHESGASWALPSVMMPVLPEKGRPVDKAEATALTYSLGYVLRGLLKIPRTDDADDLDQRDDRGRDPTPRPPARAQQKPKPDTRPAPEPDTDVAADLLETERLMDAAETEHDLKVAWGRASLLKRSISREDYERLAAKKDAHKRRFAAMDDAAADDNQGDA